LRDATSGTLRASRAGSALGDAESTLRDAESLAGAGRFLRGAALAAARDGAAWR
jgi:hypothetical protein